MRREPAGGNEDEFYQAALTLADTCYEERRFLNLEEDGRKYLQELHQKSLANPGDSDLQEMISELDREMEDISRKVRSVLDVNGAAQDTIDDAIYGTIAGMGKDDVAKARVRAKQAILKLARSLDPQASECALSLGHLDLRTPECIRLGLLKEQQGRGGKLGGTTSKPSRRQRVHEQQALLPKMDISTSSYSGWEVFEQIDNLATAAESQDHEAVLMLLSMLTTLESGTSTMDFLFRAVNEQRSGTQKRDDARCQRLGKACAVTAHWPNLGDPRQAVYAGLTDWAIEEATGQLNQSPSSEAEREVVKQSMRNQMLHDSSNGGNPFKSVAESLDTMYIKAFAEDPLYVISAEVLEVLKAIIKKSLVQLRTDEDVLYGEVETHWVERRKAAHRICHMAHGYSVLAADVMIHRLLSDSHWAVRSAAACEAIDMMDVYSQKADHKASDVLAAMAGKVIDLVVVDYIPKVSVDPQQLTELQTVRETIEQHFIKALNRFPKELRDFLAVIMVDICSKKEPTYAARCRRTSERILKAAKIDPLLVSTKKALGAQEHSLAQSQSLRKDRQRNAEKEERMEAIRDQDR